MIKLEPVRTEREFQWTCCLDDCIATTAKYYGLEYRFAYPKTWDFLYTSRDEKPAAKYSERLNTENVLDRYGFLEKYHHIGLKYHHTQDVEEIVRIIENELDAGRVLCVRMDSYYLPWDALYNSGHTNHVCMPVEVDRKNGWITVIDPFNMMVDLKFPIEQLKDASGFCVTFDIDREKNEDFDCRTILRDVVSGLLDREDRNSFDNIRAFADDLLQHFDPDFELNDNNGYFGWGPLHYRMIDLAFGRSFFCITLKYVAEKLQSEEMKQLVVRFKRMISRWNIIIAHMQRTFRPKDNPFLKQDNNRNIAFSTDYYKTRENVHRILMEEADFEEETAKMLLELLDNPKKSKIFDTGKSTDRSKTEDKQSSCLVLDEFFNNQAFGFAEPPFAANFTGNGEFILIDDSLKEKLACFEGAPFIIRQNLGSGNDNISCNGQVIEIEPFRCNRISFLINAEYGSFYEPVKLWNDKDEAREVNVGVSDFAFQTRYSEKTVWRGKSVILSENGLQTWQLDAKIFFIDCPFGESDVIKRIQLPYCSNIHIFAITLDMC